MTRQRLVTSAVLCRWPALLSLLMIAGCATESPRARATAVAPPPDTNVYFYPAQGHTPPPPEQQDRDRFECNTWAVQHSGFDPSLPSVPPRQRVQVVAGGPPPGSGVAVGAVTGALVGSAVSNPWHPAGGTLIGALAGAAIGGVADAERASHNDHLQAQANADANHAQSAALDQKALDYRHAMTACLEGRGYVAR
jgi:hypothetical protein